MASKALADTATKLIPVVECFILNKGRILLLKRSPTASKFPGFWITPGGHIDAGEDILTAAIREAEEETGIRVDPDHVELKYITFNTHVDRGETYLVFAFVINLQTDQSLVSSSEGEVAWIDLESLPGLDNIFPPVKMYFDKVLNKTSEVFYASADLENLVPTKIHSFRSLKKK